MEQRNNVESDSEHPRPVLSSRHIFPARALAFTLFILLPIFGFFAGINYSKYADRKQPSLSHINELEKHDLVVVGKPREIISRFTDDFSMIPDALVVWVCHEGGYDISGMEGVEHTITVYPITETYENEKLSAVVLSRNERVLCVYKGAREGGTLLPGIFPASPPVSKESHLLKGEEFAPPVIPNPVSLGNTEGFEDGEEGDLVFSTSTQKEVLPNNTESDSGYAFVCGRSSVQDDEGGVYGTVLVGNQCWLDRNSNMGRMVQSQSEVSPSQNGEVEKYCYKDNPALCDKDGGLYTWSEAMRYETSEGAKGICPVGWHIPTDAEWHVLENGLTQVGASCDAMRVFAHHADNPHFDCAGAGTALLAGGLSGLNIPLAGTSILIGEAWEGMPAYYTMSYVNRLRTTGLWTSTVSGGNRILFVDDSEVGREVDDHSGIASVRCIKDSM